MVILGLRMKVVYAHQCVPVLVGETLCGLEISHCHGELSKAPKCICNLHIIRILCFGKKSYILFHKHRHLLLIKAAAYNYTLSYQQIWSLTVAQIQNKQLQIVSCTLTSTGSLNNRILKFCIIFSKCAGEGERMWISLVVGNFRRNGIQLPPPPSTPQKHPYNDECEH